METIFRNREEWLNARKIGGSDLAALMGQSKWLDASRLYDRIKGIRKHEETNSERMAEGVKAEPLIRGLIALDLSQEYTVVNPPTDGYWFFTRDDKPYMTLTPDGLMYEKKTNDLWGLEIKDVELRKTEDKVTWLGGELPPQYYWQVIQYLLVKQEMKGVMLVAHLKFFEKYADEWKFDHAEDRLFPYYRDDETTKLAMGIAEKKETDFWENNIMKSKRPAMTFEL